MPTQKPRLKRLQHTVISRIVDGLVASLSFLPMPIQLFFDVSNDLNELHCFDEEGQSEGSIGKLLFYSVIKDKLVLDGDW